MSDKFKTREEIADIESREDDLYAALFYQVTGGLSQSEKLEKIKDIEYVKFGADSEFRTDQKRDESQEQANNMIWEICTFITAIGIDEAPKIKEELSKAIKVIPEIKGVDVAYLLRGFVYVGLKFLNRAYDIKNNLVDFNSDKKIENREYKLSDEILMETFAYDLYSSIAYPLSQILFYHPYARIAIDVFDIAIKAKHLEYGHGIVESMYSDDIYDLYGVRSVDYEKERQNFINNSSRQFANKNREELISTSKMVITQPILDTLKENIYGVQKSDIISNQYFEGIYNEVFVLAQEAGDFNTNVSRINELAMLNPDENVLDIANYVMYTVKSNGYVANLFGEGISNDGYWEYKNDLKTSLEKYSSHNDEEGYIIELFNKFYNLTDPKEKKMYISELTEVLEYNNKIKSKYSQKTRMKMLITLFNQYSLNELSKRLSVEGIEYNGTEKELETIRKLANVYPDQFMEDGYIDSQYLLEYYREVDSNPYNRSKHDSSYSNAMSGLSVYLDGFANKYSVRQHDLNYIVASIANDYDSCGIDKLKRRVEMTDSIIANNLDIDPKVIYDFVVENEDSLYEKYVSADNMKVVELDEPIRYSGHPDGMMNRKTEKILTQEEIAHQAFLNRNSIKSEAKNTTDIPTNSSIPYINTEVKKDNGSNMSGDNYFNISDITTGAYKLSYPHIDVNNKLPNFDIPTKSNETPIVPTVVKINDDKTLENEENDLHSQIVIKIVANLNRVRFAQ